MSQTARERILDGAIGLARTHGMAGTTVADLLAASGLARRSLYVNFAGGRDEALTAAGRRAATQLSDGLADILRTSRTVTDAVSTVIVGLRSQLEASDFAAGCPVMAAGLAGATLPDVRQAAGTAFENWHVAFATRLAADGISTDRAHTLAGLIVASFEGALAIGVATRSTRALDDVLVHLTELLDRECHDASVT